MYASRKVISVAKLAKNTTLVAKILCRLQNETNMIIRVAKWKKIIIRVAKCKKGHITGWKTIFPLNNMLEYVSIYISKRVVYKKWGFFSCQNHTINMCIDMHVLDLAWPSFSYTHFASVSLSSWEPIWVCIAVIPLLKWVLEWRLPLQAWSLIYW